MSSSTMKRIVLNERPGKGDIKDNTFRVENVPRPTANDVKEGEILIRVLELGVEPAMRGWLDDVRSYLPPVQIGEVMRSTSVSVVEHSKSNKFAKGDLIQGTAGWTEYAVQPEKGSRKISPLPKGAQTSDYLGVLGSSGQTAYWGLHDVGKIKAGEVVVVSGAAGSVGSTACQIAKIRGCRVWGIAGSKDKCDWLLSLGLDGALNYKDADFRAQFKKLPYVNCFFDNVGGEILDLVLTRLAQGARIVQCGAISAYNKPVPIKNYTTLISMRATLAGFIVFDYAARYREAEKEMAVWLAEGKIQRRETRSHGIERCPDALRGLFVGSNTGKTVVEVSRLEASAKL